MRYIIISRHQGAIEWLKKKGIGGEVKKHFSPEDIKSIQPNDVVIGNFPLNLVKQLIDRGVIVYLIYMPGMAYNERDNDLTPDEMDERGAKLVEIEKLKLQEVSWL